MAEITAAMVKELREQTQLPMMKCKKALAEVGGDEEAAKQLLSVGEKPRNEKLPIVELAAYTSVANILLNLDEVLTQE